MIYTTSDLINSIKRSGLVPVSQNTFTDEDFIFFLNEEQQTKMIPAIMSNRSDFFLTYALSDLVSGVQHYSVPPRSIGNSLKDIFYVPDASDLKVKYTLPKISVHEVQERIAAGTAPSCFYVQGNDIMIAPYPVTGAAVGSLMMYYYRRPSQLIAVSSCAKITGVSSISGTTTFTVDTDLTASLAMGDKVDFINSISPLVSWADDVVITAISASTIEVSTSDVSNEASVMLPQIDDYICPAKYTCIPQVPEEFFPIYPELVVARVMKALGNEKNYAIVQSSIKEMFLGCFGLISNRVEAEVDTVYDVNSIANALGSYGPQIVLR